VSHPFGDLIRQHLSRRHGLSQNKLADAIGQNPSVIYRRAALAQRECVALSKAHLRPRAGPH
jgi:hypothetical protein